MILKHRPEMFFRNVRFVQVSLAALNALHICTPRDRCAGLVHVTRRLVTVCEPFRWLLTSHIHAQKLNLPRHPPSPCSYTCPLPRAESSSHPLHAQGLELAAGRARERSFHAFLTGGRAPAVTVLELQLQWFADPQPLDWPELPALRQLVVKCAPGPRSPDLLTLLLMTHASAVHMHPPNGFWVAKHYWGRHEWRLTSRRMRTAALQSIRLWHATALKLP